MVIKIVNEELCALMGGSSAKITISSKPPTVIMLIGLQGSGKTTNGAKLAAYMRKHHSKRPLLVACDIYRPAAILQLQTVGRQLDIPVFEKGTINPVEIAKAAIVHANNHGNDFVILDTAGIRRKTRVTENIEYYSVNRAIKTINDADIIVLMIDAAEGLSDQDKKIASLAHDKGRGIIMALNKWDTMPQQKDTFKTEEDRIHFQFGQMEYAPIIPVSAKNGTGVDKILNTAVKMYEQLNTQIGTSRLNQALEKWLQEYPPPSGPQTRFKIKYAVQKSANPVHFILFASRLKAVSDPYISYLKNKIRKELGFSLIPVLVEVKSSSK
jgi:small GTP-binding protein